MPEPKPNINITPRPDKLFRDEGNNKKENLQISFSDLLENEFKPKTNGRKKLSAFDKEKKVNIGNIYFNEFDKCVQIKASIVDHDYYGNEVGLELYKELIKIAEQKGIDIIKSDSVVQGGAIAVWKKLQDQGYNININPKIKDSYKEFLKVYNSEKYFKQSLDVRDGESVFELILKKSENQGEK